MFDVFAKADEMPREQYEQFLEEFKPEKVIDGSQISRKAHQVALELKTLSTILDSERPDWADPAKVEPYQKKLQEL